MQNNKKHEKHRMMTKGSTMTATTGTTTTTTSTTTTSTSSSAANSSKTTPKDIQIIAAILKDMGVNDYEPRVAHQMVEFAYREFYLSTFFMLIQINAF